MSDAPLVPDAPDDLLPSVLVSPPWAAGDEPVVLKGLKAPQEPVVLEWREGEREEWLRAPYEKGSLKPLPEGTDWAAKAEVFSSGRALTEFRRGWESSKAFGEILLQAPEEIARPLLDDDRYNDAASSWLKGVVARFETEALPLALRAATKGMKQCDQLMPFRGGEVAQVVLKSIQGTLKRGFGGAGQFWFERHGPEAVHLIVPDALRNPGPKREAAEQVLRIVARKHGADVIAKAAHTYGEEATAAVARISVDPIDVYPATMPEIPEGYTPDRLPRLLLKGREYALPHSAVRHFLALLSISPTSDAGHPRVASVVEALDPESLAEFAWGLHENAGWGWPTWTSPQAFFALRRYGNDETARRLGPIALKWSKSFVWSNNGTSVLRVFQEIGTDAAARQLDLLARKAADIKRMRPGAEYELTVIARARDLSAEQLADRLVPDFGLDADGSLTLDYGPRRFTVGFDEQLVPHVVDDGGKSRKTLPKPGVRDDETLAPLAFKRFTELKKEAKTVTLDQRKRLESAMVTGRTWSAEEFRTLLVEHPLLVHLVRRLVWSATEDGATRFFRVAEDRTYADVNDDELTLSAATVALPHPLLLGEETATWAEAFADYEILQPFPQLDRPVHVLTDEQRKADRLGSFEGAEVHFGKVLGLARDSWELGMKETGGFRRTVEQKLPGDRTVQVHVEPGIGIYPSEHPTQRIEWVSLRTGREASPFGELDPVTASEILADLVALTGREPSEGAQ